MLAKHREKADALLELVQDVCSLSQVVGSGPLRDVWLLRYLIGFKFDTKLAAEKFRIMLRYRERYGLDDIRRQMEKGMKPSDFPGFDLHQSAFKIADRYLMHTMEYQFFMLDSLFLQTGRLVGYVKVMDLAGVKLSQLSWVRRWQQNASERKERLQCDLMECYPECFSKVLVVNSPSFFAMIWKLIKPFIPPRTADKVGVHQKCCPSCTDVIEPCVLPAFLGGEFQGEWRMLPS